MRHELKILEPFADAVMEGSKTFEVRENDRGFQTGDEVSFILEGHPIEREVFDITYILSGWGLRRGYVAFGIRRRGDIADAIPKPEISPEGIEANVETVPEAPAVEAAADDDLAVADGDAACTEPVLTAKGEPIPGTALFPVRVTHPDGTVTFESPKRNFDFMDPSFDIKVGKGEKPDRKVKHLKNSDRVKDPHDSIHGTQAGYQAGCRCEGCRKANRDYRRKRASR